MTTIPPEDISDTDKVIARANELVDIYNNNCGKLLPTEITESLHIIQVLTSRLSDAQAEVDRLRRENEVLEHIKEVAINGLEMQMNYGTTERDKRNARSTCEAVCRIEKKAREALND